MPWVLALSEACLVMAIVLTIARLVNYRPGAIAPLMTVMFALPVILFEFKVGRDELYYRLLQHDFGPSSRTHFRSQVPAAELIERAARRRLPESEEQNPVALQATMEQVQIALQMRLASGVERSDEITCLINEDFAREQYEVVQACERFRRAFPKSRYVPNALYLQGQALDTHIEQALALFQGMLVLRYYQDFPNPASRRSWQELRERFPNSPLATIARLRLAMLKGRAGQIDEAVALLDEQLACYRREPSATSRPGSWAAVLAKRPATSGIEVDQESAVLEGRKLRLLLAENRDPQQNDFALRRLLSLDPHHGMYRRNLEQLLDVIPERFPLTRLRDNLQVLLAAAQASRSVRIERLRAVIAQLTPQRDSDALPRARLELGVVYQEDSRNEEARVLFEEIMQKHPDTPWASDASRRLAAMGAAARTST